MAEGLCLPAPQQTLPCCTTAIKRQPSACPITYLTIYAITGPARDGSVSAVNTVRREITEETVSRHAFIMAGYVRRARDVFVR